MKHTAAAARPAAADTSSQNDAESPVLAGLPAGPALPAMVGIGASAGGLEALRTLVAQLNPGLDACYVVAQHLSPTHRSLLVDLLARETSLEVMEAADGMAPVAGRILVAPPSCHIHLRAGLLRLTPATLAGSPKPSVDELLFSLAEACGERCIGIILSGTGSDGSRGVRAVHAGGGLTMAQDPEDARYDGMPRAAIDSGCVDQVLPVAAMGERLRALLDQGLPARLPLPDGALAPADDLDQIARIVQRRIGFDLAQYKPTSMARRVRRRMVACDCNNATEYIELLRASPEEPQRLVREMFISVTSFFRDPKAFEVLEATLSALVASRENDDEELRFWVPGCATGEEAFSLAMLTCEVLDRAQRRIPVRLFATDVDRPALARARRGIYPATVQNEIPQRFHAGHLRLDSEWCTVSKRVRDMVIFSEHNLLRDPAFLRLDLVSCRNLLIYLRSGTQERVMSAFSYALKPGGLLFLGRAEAVHAGSAHFAPVDAQVHLYKARGTVLPRPPVRTPASPTIHQAPARAQDARSELGLRLLQAHTEGLLDPFVLVDDEARLVHVFGDVSAVLKLGAGEPTLDLLRLAIEPLRLELRSLLFQSQRSPRTSPRALVDLPHQQLRMNLTAMRLPDATLPLTLVLFSAQPLPQANSTPLLNDDGQRRHVEALEEQLANTRAHLQAVIGELEGANEELQSLNEELQSANEELQSANEELETSNEELQSTNEELVTVNEELETRSEEMSLINSDLQNVKNSLLDPLIVVDEHRRVVLYNPPAEQLFAFSPEAMGALLFTLPCRVQLGQAAEVLARVIDTGEMGECAVQGERSWLLRVQPYRDVNGRCKGAVLAFHDDTEARRASQVLVAAAEQLGRAERMTAATIDALPQQVCLIDHDGTILHTNQAWRHNVSHGGGNLAECDNGANYLSVCERAAAGGDRLAEAFLAGLRAVMASQCERFEQEYPCDTQDGPQWFLATVMPFVGDGPGCVVVSHENITERKWQAAHIRLQSRALDHTANGVVIVDALRDDLPVVYVNQAFEAITGYAAAEVMGRNLRFLQGDATDQPAVAMLREAAAVRRAVGVLLRNFRKGGQAFWNEMSISPISDGSGVTHLVGIMRDVTASIASEEALKASMARETQALAFAGIGSMELDVRTGMVALSDQHRLLLGLDDDCQNLPLAEMRAHVFHEDLPAFDDALRLCLTGHGALDVEFRLLSVDGSIHWLHTRGNAMLDDSGLARRLLAMTQDVTSRKGAEEHARFIAHHDALTGLPNRTLLRDRLQLALNTARRARTRLALLFLDLDRFKDVNDSLGHEIGDALLVSVATRLRGCVRDSDTVCRQSGDEFIVLLPSVRDANEAARVGEKILSQVGLPHAVLGHTIQLTCSIGIGMYPDDGTGIDELIRHADAAMYHAKGNGRNGLHFFSHALDTARSERVSVAAGLRQALHDGALELHYQPQFDVLQQRLVGMEALLRWRHPERGLIFPDAFIPAAEDSGLIDEIGEWVLHRACAQARAWQLAGLPSVPVAVNVSALQLRRREILGTVTSALSRAGLAAQWLELELTERAIIHDPQSVGELLSDFRHMGIRLALDDFGTGYSSLSYLHRFPVDKLKIDHSFVAGALGDASAAAIVGAVVQLGRSLNLDVVAEGVETAEQLAFLKRQGCASFQGFLASRALEAEAVGARLTDWAAGPLAH